MPVVLQFFRVVVSHYGSCWSYDGSCVATQPLSCLLHQLWTLLKCISHCGASKLTGFVLSLSEVFILEPDQNQADLQGIRPLSSHTKCVHPVQDVQHCWHVRLIQQLVSLRGLSICTDRRRKALKAAAAAQPIVNWGCKLQACGKLARSSPKT